MRIFGIFLLLKKELAVLLNFARIGTCSFGGGMCMSFVLCQQHLDLSTYKQIILLWQAEALLKFLWNCNLNHISLF
jgi:hypothetical protein